METTYTCVSSHAESLASGRTVAPGGTAELTDDPHDRALLADGKFVPTETSTDYGSLKHEHLAGLAEAADLEVKPTGKDGSTTKADLIKALTANDKTSKEG